MIVGLKNSIPCVIKSVPEIELNGQFIKDHLLECLKTLHKLKFIFQGVVCVNHSSKISPYTKLLSEYNDNSSYLFFALNEQYFFRQCPLWWRTFEIIFLTEKIFLFPTFLNDGFYDIINVPGVKSVADYSIKFMKKTKNFIQILVQLQYSLLRPYTLVIVRRAFQQHSLSLNRQHLLRLKFISRLGDAAKMAIRSPNYYELLQIGLNHGANWKKSNEEIFTHSAQTSHALRHTLRCHAFLIEDQLQEGYDYKISKRPSGATIRPISSNEWWKFPSRPKKSSNS